MREALETGLAKNCANTLRFLAVDMIQKANSGHPGAPMGLADAMVVLFFEYMKFDPKDAKWLGRDRFVLSNGHASSMLYSILHLCGYGLTIDDLKEFRQLGSKTPGHPEYGLTAGVETTTGPLGQGLATAVGMAIASKMLAARLPDSGDLFSGKCYVVAGDGCLMEGVTAEAASLAGRYKLDNLICLYDSNGITIEGSTNISFTEDVAARYRAYGWRVIENVDAYDHAAVSKALKAAGESSGEPVLIELKTVIGYGSPHMHGTAKVHGSPLGAEEIALTKEALGFPADKSFFVPEEVAGAFAKLQEKAAKERAAWNEKLAAWLADGAHKAVYDKFTKRPSAAELLAICEKAIAAAGDKPAATRSISGKILNELAKDLPWLVGGSADLAPSTNTYLNGYADVTEDFAGRNLRFGIREFAMAAIVNGITLSDIFTAYGATFMVFSDYLRPAVRLAALSHIPSIELLTHDSIFLGEDGPTHQPVEHIASLRLIPNLLVLRPADATEVALSWYIALTNRRRPTVMALSRQNVSPLKRDAAFKAEDVLKGAYVLCSAKEAKGTIIASGSEVELAVKVAENLAAEGLNFRVVSMPSMELFAAQDKAYKAEILGSGLKVSIEAGATMPWRALLGESLNIGIDTFGASAPAGKLAEHFGLTVPAIAERIKAALNG